MKHLTDEHIKELRERLEEEVTTLRESLSDIGQMDENGDWSVSIPDPDLAEEDPNTQADRFEETYNRGGSLASMEARLELVEQALAHMDEGTYGVSTTSGEEISLERLQANPAAMLTIKEAQEEEKLHDTRGVFDKD